MVVGGDMNVAATYRDMYHNVATERQTGKRRETSPTVSPREQASFKALLDSGTFLT